ncbi:unnamed protein product [Dicrocoelium dendriticum]|nr:unnamed protein product [Dicrocoelium dendriticum]
MRPAAIGNPSTVDLIQLHIPQYSTTPAPEHRRQPHPAPQPQKDLRVSDAKSPHQPPSRARRDSLRAHILLTTPTTKATAPHPEGPLSNAWSRLCALTPTCFPNFNKQHLPLDAITRARPSDFPSPRSSPRALRPRASHPLLPTSFAGVPGPLPAAQRSLSSPRIRPSHHTHRPHAEVECLRDIKSVELLHTPTAIGSNHRELRFSSAAGPSSQQFPDRSRIPRYTVSI